MSNEGLPHPMTRTSRPHGPSRRIAHRHQIKLRELPCLHYDHLFWHLHGTGTIGGGIACLGFRTDPIPSGRKSHLILALWITGDKDRLVIDGLLPVKWCNRKLDTARPSGSLPSRDAAHDPAARCAGKSRAPSCPTRFLLT